MTGGPLGSFADCVIRSGLFSETKFVELLARAPDSARSQPSSIADWLVAQDALTQFQADKLLAGTWQGLKLGRYRVLAPIGRGGMGIVYLAAIGESNEGNRVALKIVPPKVAREEPRRLARFIREIQIGLSIGPHAHIAQTLSGGEIDTVHYLAMQFVPGPTLKKRVATSGPIPPTEAANLFAGLADALAFVHQSGIVHRDFKPANVVLTPGGRATLLDFGFAIRPGEPLPDDPRIVGGKGYVIGTMDYIAPEQIRDATAVTPASDLYSLGCTLFYALTGTPPYPGGDTQQKLRWHQSSDVPDVRAINPVVPIELAAVVARLLHKDVDKRCQSAALIRDELRMIGGPAIVTIDPVGFEQAIGELTHHKTTPSELHEPIVEDTVLGYQRSTNQLPNWFWFAVTGLGVFVLGLVILSIWLLTSKR